MGKVIMSSNMERRHVGFEVAVGALKQGNAASRAGWPEGMRIFLVGGSQFKVNRAPLNEIFLDNVLVDYGAHIDIITPSEVTEAKKVRVWTPSTEDILAEDWEIYV